MTDRLGQRLPLDNEFSQDGLYQQMVMLAAEACQGWAFTEATSLLNAVLLWPRDRGPVECQEAPYRVNQSRVERGIWRVTLCAAQDVPAGVTAGTRDQVLRAQVSGSAQHMRRDAIDQIVQCGLFGEVIYR